MTADVVGPDLRERRLPRARPRDGRRDGRATCSPCYDVGAYGYVMASNYNTRGRGAEVLVDGDRYAVVTARETYEDLVRLEVADPEWRTA